MKKIISNKHDLLDWIQYLKEACVEGNGPYVASFGKQKKFRSISQNKLLWSWYNCIETEGYGVGDSDLLHEYFKSKFLPWIKSELFGETFGKALSTTQLSTVEFNDYLERIRVFMIDQGITLLYPEDEGFNTFYSYYGDQNGM